MKTKKGLEVPHWFWYFLVCHSFASGVLQVEISYHYHFWVSKAWTWFTFRFWILGDLIHLSLLDYWGVCFRFFCMLSSQRFGVPSWRTAWTKKYGLYWGRRSKQPKTINWFTGSPCFMYNSILHDSCKTFDTCICANSVWHSVSTALNIAGQRQYFDDFIKTLLSAPSYTIVSLQLPQQRKDKFIHAYKQILVLALGAYWKRKHLMLNCT